MKDLNFKIITGAFLMTVAFCLLVVIFILFAVTEIPLFSESHTIYLTEEEMENRPVIEPIITETSVNNVDSIEIVECEEEPVFIPCSDIPLDDYLQELATELCKEYKVGYAFFLSICESESGFDTEARGDSGKSLGLMQINRPNWERYNLDASMVSDNLEIGIRMLAELIEKYGETDAVIMAYKGGESFADSWIAEGKRLTACDEVVDRTMYWQSVIDGFTE